MPTYEIVVTLNEETVAALHNGSQIQAFKGVKSANPTGALPTVWFTQDHFSNSLSLRWTDQTEGYFSHQPIREGVIIDPAHGMAMETGQLLTLNRGGNLVLSSNGFAGNAYSFTSEKPAVWASGLATTANGNRPAPVCAFPQYGAVGNIIEPFERVVLLFSKSHLKVGSMVRTVFTQSVTVTLSPRNPAVELEFDIRGGWKSNGETNVKVNQKGLDLAAKLILPN